MRIRIARLIDAETILLLQRLCFQSEAAIHGDYGIAPLHETLAEIKIEFDRRTFLKAMEGPSIVGAVRASSDGDTCHVGRLVVHPLHQDKGIGTALLLAVESVFMTTRRLELFTGQISTKNLALYRKLGYKELRREESRSGLSLIFLEKRV